MTNCRVCPAARCREDCNPAPSFTEVQRIYREARKSIRGRWCGRAAGPQHQAWLRKVSAEFQRRLALAGIHVECAA